MLLLLKSPPTGVAAATLGLTIGLSAIAGPTAILGLVLGLTPPESIELNVSVTPDVHFGLSGISTGFLSRSAILDTHLDLPAMGGFGASPTVDIKFGLSGTVGLFLQSTATPGITLGLTANMASQGVGSLSTVFGLTGLPTISGGTVTPSASAGVQMSLAGMPVQIASSVLDINLNLTATAIAIIPNLATDMRLSFEADEIRLFFRRG